MENCKARRRTAAPTRGSSIHNDHNQSGLQRINLKTFGFPDDSVAYMAIGNGCKPHTAHGGEFSGELFRLLQSLPRRLSSLEFPAQDSYPCERNPKAG